MDTMNIKNGYFEYCNFCYYVQKKRRCRDKLRFRTRTRKGVFSKEAPIAAQVLQT